MLSRAEAPAAMSNAPAAPPQRPLAGDAGYKRLVRLLGRAFYAGECPPREPEEEVPAGARTIRRDKASRCRQGCDAIGRSRPGHVKACWSCCFLRWRAALTCCSSVLGRN